MLCCWEGSAPAEPMAGCQRGLTREREPTPTTAAERKRVAKKSPQTFVTGLESVRYPSCAAYRPSQGFFVPWVVKLSTAAKCGPQCGPQCSPPAHHELNIKVFEADAHLAVAGVAAAAQASVLFLQGLSMNQTT